MLSGYLVRHRSCMNDVKGRESSSLNLMETGIIINIIRSTITYSTGIRATIQYLQSSIKIYALELVPSIMYVPYRLLNSFFSGYLYYYYNILFI